MASTLEKAALKDKFLGGAAWVTITQAAVHVGQFALVAGLAHLLTPGDFGILALCLVVTGTSAIFRDIGLPSAVIQLPVLREGHKNAAFWVSLATAAAVAAAVYFGAPTLASLLRDDRVVPALRVLSAGLIVNAFGLIPAALLTRAMDFRRLGICDVAQVAANAAVAVPMALAGCGYWSLVFGSLAGDAARASFAFAFAPWRPARRFGRRDARELMSFGLNVTGAGFAHSLRSYLDKFLVGRFLGTSFLGGYNLAFALITAPQRRITWIVSRLTFPAFAAIQNDDERIRRIYAKAVKLVVFLAAPVAVGLFFMADDFVRVVYGPQWLFTIPVIKVMSAATLFYAVGTSAGSVFLAKGRADLEFKASVFMTVLLALAVAIGLKWGSLGIAAAIVAYAAVGYAVVIAVVLRLIGMKWGAFLKLFAPGVLAAASFGTAAWAVRAAWSQDGGLARLLVTAAAGAITYGAVLWLQRVPELGELNRFARARMRRFPPTQRLFVFLKLEPKCESPK